jgi:AraC family transcriptional regulator, regulatory protein of adaptative response / methylated-DNA-[protein]-cysteine methyltransferase
MPQPRPIEFDVIEEARFRAAFDAGVGTSRTDGESLPVSIDWASSPVGPLLIGATDEAIAVLEFSSTDQLSAQLERLRKQLRRPLVHATTPLLDRLRAQLDQYFAGTRRDFDLPLEYHGSEFQERVWAALQHIPYGETCSYGALAKKLGDANAMRAVGAANGLNPIAIVIPCHRVVNANGALGGYGGGLWRKQILLDLEQGQGRLF